MRSLTSPRAKRISGSKKFCASPKKDFFNAIRQEATFLLMNARCGYARGWASFRKARGLREPPLPADRQNGVSDDKLTTDECACPAENLQVDYIRINEVMMADDLNYTLPSAYSYDRSSPTGFRHDVCPPAILQFFNMTLRWEQKYSRRRVRSGSYLAHLDRPAACVATEGPEHRCFDRRCPRELG